MQIFDYLKQIIQKNDITFIDKLNERDKKEFNPFMIQKFLSMNDKWIYLINFINKWVFTIEKEHYFKLVTLLIPNQNNTYFKYIKGKNDIKYNKIVVEKITDYFNVSKKEAIEYYKLLSKERKIELVMKYGLSDKEIQKIKKDL